MMAASDVKKLLELDLETRLALVQQLWDSIVHDASTGAKIPLTVVERELLDQRLREDDAEPDAAIPWTEARERLRAR